MIRLKRSCWRGGNFYLNFNFEGGSLNQSKTIVDPSLVFGEVSDFTYPKSFMSEEFKVPEKQVNVGYTPCGFGYKELTLKKGEEDVTYTLIGSAPSFDRYTDFIQTKIKPGYMESKIEENKELIEQTKEHIATVSSSKAFDAYCGQTFMDNYLRGGYPVKVGNGRHALYVYSRKHGDLEREYNFFQVDSTNFSQGNANFRDVNQNRRNDVYYFPFIEDQGIKIFFNLLQLDGFNPLVLNGSRFEAEDQKICTAIVNKYFDEAAAVDLCGYITKAFTPGGLLLYIEQKSYVINGEVDVFINELLEHCQKEDVATFLEGYWVDHWTYNNDLLEQFIAVYPDKIADAMFVNKDYTYFDNDEVVVPRTRRYVLTGDGVRQYGAVQKVPEKTDMIAKRDARPNQVRKDFGKGEVYWCSLASKIMVLLVNKAASLDPNGVGLEMEGNKPGWCDALNGLPGILGSSINESSEVMRLAKIMKEVLVKTGDVTISLPEEVKEFYDQIKALLIKEVSPIDYWQQSNDAKEAYREKVIFGISGIETEIDSAEALTFMEAVITRLEAGLAKAFNKETGVYDTYFINEAADYEVLKDEAGNIVKNENEYPLVQVKEFKSRPIPPFLEGQVHMMRADHSVSAKLHQAVKNSGMYDAKLDMFKVNADIMDETKEIGRQNVFPRGWLENEAVFLHMEYKYFLELLRSGLYEEFSHYLKTSFVPFLDPAVYGRSTLENVSFIASSAHPDDRIHGGGYVSRLTGASCEMLTIWRLMTVGETPFIVNEEGGLCMELNPQIPAWLFTKTEGSIPADSFGFTMLGSIPTVYRNENRYDTYEEGVQVVKITIYQDGKELASFDGNRVPAPFAKQIRDGQIDRIEAVIDKNSKGER